MVRQLALAVAIVACGVLFAMRARADEWVPGHYGANGLWIPQHVGPGPALVPPGPTAVPYAVWVPGWVDAYGGWHQGYWGAAP